MGRRIFGGGSNQLSFGSRRGSDARAQAWAKPVLWLAVLIFGAHAGASLYEMLVVTPLWASAPPQSVRDFRTLMAADIRPMDYKEPAVLLLGLVSGLMLWISHGRSAARGWMVLAGVLGIVVVATTLLFAFPILERLRSGGAGLTDQQIIAEVRAWKLWCDIRLVALLTAWTASLIALVRSSARSTSDPFR